ncbi:hypothetical protein CLF_110981 [Clonorchis sinensis]|uniref:Uncharacterized protein n=2 Tax=Clonorchis sinensis TaxID=79923 RepID=G7YU55_CLOSI|nr:hypothetical protein CLF_110981 [Clonorchis sinensis]
MLANYRDRYLSFKGSTLRLILKGIWVKVALLRWNKVTRLINGLNKPLDGLDGLKTAILDVYLKRQRNRNLQVMDNKEVSTVPEFPLTLCSTRIQTEYNLWMYRIHNRGADTVLNYDENCLKANCARVTTPIINVPKFGCFICYVTDISGKVLCSLSLSSWTTVSLISGSTQGGTTDSDSDELHLVDILQHLPVAECVRRRHDSAAIMRHVKTKIRCINQDFADCLLSWTFYHYDRRRNDRETAMALEVQRAIAANFDRFAALFSPSLNGGLLNYIFQPVVVPGTNETLLTVPQVTGASFTAYLSELLLRSNKNYPVTEVLPQDVQPNQIQVTFYPVQIALGMLAFLVTFCMLIVLIVAPCRYYTVYKYRKNRPKHKTQCTSKTTIIEELETKLARDLLPISNSQTMRQKLNRQIHHQTKSRTKCERLMVRSALLNPYLD